MISESAHRLIVAYDVSDDVRRTRLAKTLESFGDRIQYSVFVVDAKPAKLVRLRAALRRTINTNADSVMICDLGPLNGGTDKLEFIGQERPYTGTGPLIL